MSSSSATKHKLSEDSKLSSDGSKKLKSAQQVPSLAVKVDSPEGKVEGFDFGRKKGVRHTVVFLGPPSAEGGGGPALSEMGLYRLYFKDARENGPASLVTWKCIEDEIKNWAKVDVSGLKLAKENPVLSLAKFVQENAANPVFSHSFAAPASAAGPGTMESATGKPLREVVFEFMKKMYGQKFMWMFRRPFDVPAPFAFVPLTFSGLASEFAQMSQMRAFVTLQDSRFTPDVKNPCEGVEYWVSPHIDYQWLYVNSNSNSKPAEKEKTREVADAVAMVNKLSKDSDVLIKAARVLLDVLQG